MYRIRFHGRGGQGMKTAARILGTAFFLEGFEVQDAPRYGAERRGAPIFAYLRASRETIKGRGIIHRPDLVVVADESLVPMASAGVLPGLSGRSVLLIHSSQKPEYWKMRLNVEARILTMPELVQVNEQADQKFVGAVCAAAAARLVGVISRCSLEQAIREELAPLGEVMVRLNMEKALPAYDALEEYEAQVTEGQPIAADSYERPDWVDLPFEDARISAPIISTPATSSQVHTGLWRTLRPLIDYQRCKRCWCICSTFCPDSAIKVTAEGYPEIDYDSCKGCMICAVECPTHSIELIPEQQLRVEETVEGK
jgi:pyruvate ferredoxin oxidoreductase gamma subunit